ncbi:hypothetical protein AB0C40_29360 [Streptomyces brevispora]|uniref:hypothetical protein n=1 Tax=Streptomyces brevispora TaxID=887462 RepID=UPI0033E0B8FD
MTARRIALFTAAIAAAVTLTGGVAADRPVHPDSVRADSGWQTPVPATQSGSGEEAPATPPGDDSGWQ